MYAYSSYLAYYLTCSAKAGLILLITAHRHTHTYIYTYVQTPLISSISGTQLTDCSHTPSVLGAGLNSISYELTEAPKVGVQGTARPYRVFVDEGVLPMSRKIFSIKISKL